jgi:hypothetical protein
MLRCQSTVASSEDGWTRIWVSHSRPCDTGAPKLGAHQVLKETRNSCTTSLQTDKARNSAANLRKEQRNVVVESFNRLDRRIQNPAWLSQQIRRSVLKTIKYILINNLPSRRRAPPLSATPDDYVPRQIQLGFADDFLGMRRPEVGR